MGSHGLSGDTWVGYFRATRSPVLRAGLVGSRGLSGRMMGSRGLSGRTLGGHVADELFQMVQKMEPFGKHKELKQRIIGPPL
eukprot:492788-Rhodomonas_salina.2